MLLPEDAAVRPVGAEGGVQVTQVKENAPTRVDQELEVLYWLVNQKVQSLAGSTLMAA